jgi:hypothetical protein
MKNLILLFLLATTASNSKAWQVEIVNNSGCNINISLVDKNGGILLNSVPIGPGTHIICPGLGWSSINVPEYIDFTESGPCITRLYVPGTSQCASCNCSCINLNRIFTATYNYVAGCNTGLYIEIN